MKKVSIVILNYNTFDLTVNCIKSILKLNSPIDHEIILVDNGSSENERKFSDVFPNISVITLPVNVGFSKGNNIGVEAASGKYVLLLNSDTIVKTDVLKILSDFLDNHADVAAISGRLEFEDGTIQHCCQRFPSVGSRLFELLRLQKVLPNSISEQILLGSFFAHDRVIYPDWIWGTCFMFRIDLLSKLPNKKLAEDFFMYGEDLQWCIEFGKIGYRVAFHPGARLIHLMGQSGGSKTKQMYDNMRLILKRYYSPYKIFIIDWLDKLLIRG